MRFMNQLMIMILLKMILSASLLAAVPRFAYVANDNDGTISIFLVDSNTGKLRSNGYFALESAGSNPGPFAIAITPDQKFLYTSNHLASNISAFNIDQQTGQLTAGSNFLVGTNPLALTIDPFGRFLYVANQDSDTISAFAINPTNGNLFLLETEPGGDGPRGIFVDPSGNFLYVANFLSDDLSVFSIESDGRLSLLQIVPAGDGPVGLKVHSSGNSVYVVNGNNNGGGSGSISVFSRQNDGTLIAIQEVLAESLPRGIDIDPSGRFVYITNAGSGSISAFEITVPTGRLVNVTGSPFTAEASPNSVAVDPSGTFLYASNSSSNSISMFSINSTGQLTSLQSIRTRDGATAIAISSGLRGVTVLPVSVYATSFQGTPTKEVIGYSILDNGRLDQVDVEIDNSIPVVLALNQIHGLLYSIGNDSVRSFRILEDGTLQFASVTGRFGISGSFCAATDPSGRFLFVCDEPFGPNGSRGISMYRTEPDGSIVSAGKVELSDLVIDLAIDPAGHFLFAAINGIGIRTYEIDPLVGSLIEGPTSAQSSSSLAIHPSGRFIFSTITNQDTVQAFSINPSNGALSQVNSVDNVTSPGSIQVTPDGRFVFVGSQSNNAITKFAVNGMNGQLIFVAGQAANGGAPHKIAIEPTSRFVYVANIDTDDISSYAISDDCCLSFLENEPNGGGPSSIIPYGVIADLNTDSNTDLFFDDFEDEDASDWSFTKGTWSVVGGDLKGISTKKADNISPFIGCSVCEIEAELRIETAGGRTSLLAWFQDKRDLVEIVLMEDRDKIVFKQKVNGEVVAKTKFLSDIDINTNYRVGAQFQNGVLFFLLNGSVIAQLNTPFSPNGTVGFRVKSTTGAPASGGFRQIRVF